MGTPGRDLRERLITVARRPRREPLVLENARDKIANIRFVVDYQNVMCHGWCLPCQLLFATSVFV
jgi:hypothetical protein